VNNSDKPAMPISREQEVDVHNALAFPSSHSMPMIGLTKREHFAGLAMQALITTSPHWEVLGGKCPSYNETAIEAYAYADSLLNGKKGAT
jgi:hypothetical protein